MSKAEILQRIVKESKRWDGIQEIPGNMGWEHEEFQRMMRDVGWDFGLAWCMFYVKMIYYKVFGNTEYGLQIYRDLTGGAVQSLHNCQQSPRWMTDVRNEVEGAIVIWRNKPHPWHGHAGIVIQAGAGEIGSHFITSEGNTNSIGGREGGVVEVGKTRVNNHGDPGSGLVVEGFILPPMPLEKVDPKIIELPYE